MRFRELLTEADDPNVLARLRFVLQKPFDPSDSNYVNIYVGDAKVGSYLVEKPRPLENEDGRYVAEANGHMQIIEAYRRKGIATKFYQWLRELLAEHHIKHVPSPYLTDGAYEFWSKHSPGSTAKHVNKRFDRYPYSLWSPRHKKDAADMGYLTDDDFYTASADERGAAHDAFNRNLDEEYEDVFEGVMRKTQVP